MGDQVIGLKHESNGMVPVRIPVLVFIIFGRNFVDDQISAVVLIQTADNVEQCCFSGTAGAQDCNKLIIP